MNLKIWFKDILHRWNQPACITQKYKLYVRFSLCIKNRTQLTGLCMPMFSHWSSVWTSVRSAALERVPAPKLTFIGSYDEFKPYMLVFRYMLVWTVQAYIQFFENVYALNAFFLTVYAIFDYSVLSSRISWILHSLVQLSNCETLAGTFEYLYRTHWYRRIFA